jgi:hypothetical protein
MFVNFPQSGASPEAEISLDPQDQPSPELFRAAVHWEHREALSPVNPEVAAVSRLERAAALGKPALELVARHLPYYTTLLLWAATRIH